MTGLDETFPLALLPLCVSMSQPTFSGTDFQKYMSAIERNVIRLCSGSGYSSVAAAGMYTSIEPSRYSAVIAVDPRLPAISLRSPIPHIIPTVALGHIVLSIASINTVCYIPATLCRIVSPQKQSNQGKVGESRRRKTTGLRLSPMKACWRSCRQAVLI